MFAIAAFASIVAYSVDTCIPAEVYVRERVPDTPVRYIPPLRPHMVRAFGNQFQGTSTEGVTLSMDIVKDDEDRKHHTK